MSLYDLHTMLFRIVVKITGLPFQYNCSDLITFLGFWPRNGTDGIRMVCDT